MEPLGAGLFKRTPEQNHPPLTLTYVTPSLLKSSPPEQSLDRHDYRRVLEGEIFEDVEKLLELLRRRGLSADSCRLSRVQAMFNRGSGLCSTVKVTYALPLGCLQAVEAAGLPHKSHKELQLEEIIEKMSLVHPAFGSREVVSVATDTITITNGALDPSEGGQPPDLDLGEADVIVEVRGKRGEEERSHVGTPLGVMIGAQQLVFFVLNLSTGEERKHTMRKMQRSDRTQSGEEFTLRAPLGFCIAGFFGQPYFLHARMGWPVEGTHTVDIHGAYFKRCLTWSVDSHRLFPQDFKMKVKLLLLASRCCDPALVQLARLSSAEVQMIILLLAETSLLPATGEAGAQVCAPAPAAARRNNFFWGTQEDSRCSVV